MQDVKSGNMNYLNEKEVLDLKGEEVSDDVIKTIKSQGVCVLQLGQPLEIKGGKFTVFKIEKHKVMLETDADIKRLGIRVGESFTVEGGAFRVSAFGKKFLSLQGLAGTKAYSEAELTRRIEAQEKAIELAKAKAAEKEDQKSV